ncbi:MAG: PQQ-binding-like beta-propeller repeat protein [Bryobacterales bacterium]
MGRGLSLDAGTQAARPSPSLPARGAASPTSATSTQATPRCARSNRGRASAWEFRLGDMSESGILSTKTNVLFAGSREGHFFALDARDGKLLWRRYLGGQVIAAPVSYEVEGKQKVAIAAGHALFVLELD